MKDGPIAHGANEGEEDAHYGGGYLDLRPHQDIMGVRHVNGDEHRRKWAILKMERVIFRLENNTFAPQLPK